MLTIIYSIRYIISDEIGIWKKGNSSDASNSDESPTPLLLHFLFSLGRNIPYASDFNSTSNSVASVKQV